MAIVQCKDLLLDNVAAVFWDKDGTLADSHAFLQKLAAARSHLLEKWVPGITSHLMAAFGCNHGAYDPAGLMAVGTRYENEIAAAAYVAATGYPWGEALEMAKQAFSDSDRLFRRKAGHTPPFSGILPMLKNCHSFGLKLAILSGDTTANVQDFVDCYRLGAMIEWCAGSEQVPAKPDPQMFQNACQRLGVAPHQTIVIGDSVLDYQLAHQGKAKAFVSVTWGGSSAIAGADATLTWPHQLTVLPEPVA
ncbi:MAG: HAD family hydrolase [Leptolyngbya sp. SIO1D8]|nr:HAD family hydrolase [Leptolyngbya sp. SIO1D8]